MITEELPSAIQEVLDEAVAVAAGLEPGTAEARYLAEKARPRLGDPVSDLPVNVGYELSGSVAETLAYAAGLEPGDPAVAKLATDVEGVVRKTLVARDGRFITLAAPTPKAKKAARERIARAARELLASIADADKETLEAAIPFEEIASVTTAAAVVSRLREHCGPEPHLRPGRPPEKEAREPLALVCIVFGEIFDAHCAKETILATSAQGYLKRREAQILGDARAAFVQEALRGTGLYPSVRIEVVRRMLATDRDDARQGFLRLVARLTIAPQVALAEVLRRELANDP